MAGNSKRIKRISMTVCQKTDSSYGRTAIVSAVLIFVLVMSSFSGFVSAEERKVPMKAFLLSFLVPGLGQYYAGSPGYSKLFIAAELALWGGYFYNTSLQDASKQDYYSQAALHAGINPKGMGGLYLNAIGAYDSSFDYNQYQLQSDFHPVLYTGAKAWEWDSTDDRREFRRLRERELDYENNVKLFIAGVVLNHFLAGLNASMMVQKNNEMQSAMTVNVLGDGLQAMYRRSF